MTMHAYGTPGVPADSTGTYPALAGYTPMDTGRRVAVALGDAGIAVAAVFLATMVAAVMPRNAGGPLIVYIGVIGASLWALFAKSARLAGVPMHATYVDVQTGLPAGGKLLLKQLLTGAISSVSFGIAPLVMYFATVQEPLKRNWFDRTMGLMLVDWRTGRRPGDPLPPTEAPRGVAPGATGVQFPAMPTTDAPGGLPRPPEQASWPGQAASAAPVFESPAAASDAPTPTPPFQAPAPAFEAPASGFQPASTFAPLVEAGGIITSTPHSAGRPTPPPEPAADARPPVVVREMRSVDAAEDHTVLAEDSALAASPGSHLFLDDATPIRLDPPTVIGRNPQAPGSHPDAVPHEVADPRASKTHLLAGCDETGPWIIDLHSTNGVAVIRVPGGEPVRIEAGRKVHLAPGASAVFGDHRLVAR